MKGTKFQVLNDGHIIIDDWMGSDEQIARKARNSYQKGTKSVSDDRTLIRHLMRNHHSSPFEFAELILHVRVPMDTWRQWIRHRTANVNEYSTRYSEAIDSMEKTKPDEWRLQSGTNKQGSSGLLEEWPEGYDDVNKMYTPGQYLCIMEKEFHDVSKFLYETRLKFNVAREQARKDLPLSNYTEAFWKIDLHNLLHFLQLRMDSHAQLEIRSYANIIGNEIVAKLFPITWEAFIDYRLEAITLTRLEIKILADYLQVENDIIKPTKEIITNKREHDEALYKFKKLGILM